MDFPSLSDVPFLRKKEFNGQKSNQKEKTRRNSKDYFHPKE